MRWNDRVHVKGKIKDYQGAIEDFSKAIEFRPSDAIAYKYRGMIKMLMGQIENGCLDLNKAGELGSEEAYKLMKENCEGYTENSKPVSNSIAMIEKNGVYKISFC